MKLIRECRMGLPKCFKTGAVVSSYPKPMLYLGFDRGGLDVVPKANTQGAFSFDTLYDEVSFIKPGALGSLTSETKQPKILAVDFTVNQTMSLDNALRPAAAADPYNKFITDYNQVASHINAGKPLPWKTVVLDSVTGFEDVCLAYIASVNPNAMSDARQWAGICSGMVRRTILSLTTWPCHVVIIMHAAMDKNELTGAIVEGPSVFGANLRTDMGGLFSQFFYQVRVNGAVKVWTVDKLFVRGIGARWPVLPDEVNPDFNSLYGKELQ